MARQRKTSAATVEDLLKRARSGERAALDRLVEMFAPELTDWARQKTGGRIVGVERPSDIAQETVLRVFEKFSTFRGNSEGEFRAWLGRILSSRIGQAQRKALSQKPGEQGVLPLDSPEAQHQAVAEPSPSQNAAHEEEWQKLLTFIFELPDPHREAVWLCYLKEMSAADAARQTGRTEGAVAGYLARGLKMLHQRMQGLSEHALDGEPHDPAQEEMARVLLDYLRRRDMGESVNVEEFIAAHSGTQELRIMIGWVQRIQAIRPRTARRA